MEVWKRLRINGLPVSCPLCQKSFPKTANDITMWHQMASQHHTMLSQNIIWHDKVNLRRFFTWWPWPLTYDLEHRTHPKSYQGPPLCRNLRPFVTRFSRERADRGKHRQTDRQTGPIYTFDRWCPEKNCKAPWQCRHFKKSIKTIQY